MKKAILISFLAVVTLSACKKNYTCTCSYNQPDGSLYVNQTTYFKTTKKAAKTNCIDYQTNTQLGGVYSYGVKANCSLK